MSEQDRELLYYEHLLQIVTDELNVKELKLAIAHADGKELSVSYHYDTLAGKSIGFRILLDGTEVSAPRTLLMVLRTHFNKGDL
jgi:hypothetical protein